MVLEDSSVAVHRVSLQDGGTCHADVSCIYDDVIHMLQASCDQLEFLDLSFCKFISLEDVAQFKEDFPNVNIKRSFS